MLIHTLYNYLSLSLSLIILPLDAYMNHYNQIPKMGSQYSLLSLTDTLKP
ncbi:hypothetical protein [Candidatus Cardinium sp. cBcalN2]|nr:hypothetical protein [Candidatus Cardinium sp. cBcalN2]